MSNIVLSIQGMHCESCARMIEGIFEENGFLAVVDFEKCRAKVNYEDEDEKIKIVKIIALMGKRGYKINFL
jgi:copper chaperone CopZ